jgi:hypothetical protein
MYMKLKLTTIAVLLALATSFCCFAADAPKGDKAALIGSWSVVEGTYSDGSLEKELEMSFAFKAATMTSPMDDTELPYTLDEKAKIIQAKTDKSSVLIKYRLVDAKTMEILEMTVQAEKKMTIVGPGGTFKLLKLAKK